MTTKKTTTSKTSTKTENQASETQTFESADYTRERPQRRKVYERVRESDIPQYVRDHMMKEGYALRFVRWSIHGEPDYRYLNRREKEGYEFVKKEDLPEEYLRSMKSVNVSTHQGLITNGGDLCLMKVDVDLQKSREQYFSSITDAEVSAVDANVLNKKGFITHGSKSNVMLREPSFQN